MDHLKGTCAKAWKKSLSRRLAVHVSSQRHRLFFSHQKTWKCRAPHSTAPISWWYPAVHSVGREKCNSNDSISRGRGTSTCQILRSTAQNQPVHRSALTCLSEWERRVTHRQRVCVCVCVCWIKTHPVHEIVPRCQRKCTTDHIGRIVAPLFLTTKPSLSF